MFFSIILLFLNLAAAAPVLVRARFPSLSLSFSLFPSSLFRRSERADALVWSASARLAVNGSLNPLPRRLLSRCWPVSSKPQDLSSFECNAVTAVRSKQNYRALSFPFSSLDPNRTFCLLSNAHSHANFGDGNRFSREVAIPIKPPLLSRQFDYRWIEYTNVQTVHKYTRLYVCIYAHVACTL